MRTFHDFPSAASGAGDDVERPVQVAGAEIGRRSFDGHAGEKYSTSGRQSVSGCAARFGHAGQYAMPTGSGHGIGQNQHKERLTPFQPS